MQEIYRFAAPGNNHLQIIVINELRPSGIPLAPSKVWTEIPTKVKSFHCMTAAIIASAGARHRKNFAGNEALFALPRCTAVLRSLLINLRTYGMAYALFSVNLPGGQRRCSIGRSCCCRICSLLKLFSMPNEGAMTKAIEEQAAKVPSTVFLIGALTSMGVSLAFKLAGCKHTALFLGQWAAPFLLLGLYNKIVKTEGHD